MEANAPLTRKRRKPAHSTKCPCCSEDRGKPEKEPRRRRREDVDLEPSNATAGDDRSTPTKKTQVVMTNSKVIETENQCSSEIDDGEICEGRVLRSGQSTPVPSEIDKEKTNSRSKKANSKKVAKKSVLANQKGGRKYKKSPANKDTEKKKGKRSLVQDSDKFKPISSTQANRAKTKSSQANQDSDQVEKISKKVEKKPPRQSIKKTSIRKHVKLPPARRKTLATKTLAIDKLKIRAFDNLKEKLEIAFQLSSLTVPECVELFQKITTENLKVILESEGPAMKGEPSEEIESGDDEEVTESSSEARAMEKQLAENMNESEAAKALVSFKVQTTAINSTLCQSQTSSTAQEFQNALMNSLLSQANAVSSINNSLKHVDSLTATTFTGVTGVPFKKPLKATDIQASAPSVILQTTPVPSIPIVQTPMAIQLLQVPTSQPTKGNHPGDLQGTAFQQTPGFIYPNPTTMINKLTSLNQQATSLFPPTINQLLYLAKLNQQREGNSLLNPNFRGFLPAMQTQEFSSASGSVTCTSLANTGTTISTLGSTSTNINEIQSSTKLRPILPREPSVAQSFSSFANQGVKPGASSNTLPKVTTQSSNIHVKQEIKRMVSERTKANDVLNPEVKPDIAGTFTKSSVRTTNSLESYQSDSPLGPKHSVQQETTEMTSKEQAINALLSIGGNENLSQHGNGEPRDGSGKRSYETNETNDLKVVFESDKGIFKVDNVTIDPLINTISKESYKCGKCNKIFTSLSYLARHIKRVCPDMSHRKWKCDHCEKAFRHPFGLQQHIYTHTGERPHKCPQCPKAFYSSNDLRRHSRIHSGERPYKCKHCGKNFATTISLKTHTFIHTGEKPHRCPHCTKTFATSSKLGRHIVTHSEQRPYSCNQCPKTFNRSGDLRRHTLHVHDGKLTDNSNADQHEEKTYRCTECSGAFDTAKELEAHINEHTTEITQKMSVPSDSVLN